MNELFVACWEKVGDSDLEDVAICTSFSQAKILARMFEANMREYWYEQTPRRQDGSIDPAYTTPVRTRIAVYHLEANRLFGLVPVQATLTQPLYQEEFYE
jgi:hypothetical protein